eukprot:TCONS_00002868-protein
MKIDRSKIKKSSSEVPGDCQKVIQFLKTCSDEELLQKLEQINVWYFGKVRYYSSRTATITGLEITVGHRTLSDPIAEMSAQIDSSRTSCPTQLLSVPSNKLSDAL